MAPVFEWGPKVKGLLSSYESMHYKGVEYKLHDCVIVRSNSAQPHIGKIMRLFKSEGGVNKVRLRWFFRPNELPVAVRKEIMQSSNKKELFIAQGNVKGVENDNLVEVILEKALVLCTAKCGLKPLPSKADVDKAHFLFNRVYDAAKKKLNKITLIEKSLAEKLFNKREWLSVPADGSRSPTSVRDFDTNGASVIRSAGSKTMVINHIKRPPMETLVPNDVKRPALDPRFFVKPRAR